MSHMFTRLINSCKPEHELRNVQPQIKGISKAIDTFHKEVLGTVREIGRWQVHQEPPIQNYLSTMAQFEEEIASASVEYTDGYTRFAEFWDAVLEEHKSLQDTEKQHDKASKVVEKHLGKKIKAETVSEPSEVKIADESEALRDAQTHEQDLRNRLHTKMLGYEKNLHRNLRMAYYILHIARLDYYRKCTDISQRAIQSIGSLQDVRELREFEFVYEPFTEPITEMARPYWGYEQPINTINRAIMSDAAQAGGPSGPSQLSAYPPPLQLQQEQPQQALQFQQQQQQPPLQFQQQPQQQPQQQSVPWQQLEQHPPQELLQQIHGLGQQHQQYQLPQQQQQQQPQQYQQNIQQPDIGYTPTPEVALFPLSTSDEDLGQPQFKDQGQLQQQQPQQQPQLQQQFQQPQLQQQQQPQPQLFGQGQMGQGGYSNVGGAEGNVPSSEISGVDVPQNLSTGIGASDFGKGSMGGESSVPISQYNPDMGSGFDTGAGMSSQQNIPQESSANVDSSPLYKPSEVMHMQKLQHQQPASSSLNPPSYMNPPSSSLNPDYSSKVSEVDMGTTQPTAQRSGETTF